MLNKLAAIENFINKLLLRFFAVCTRVLLFLIPTGLTNKIKKSKLKIKNKVENSKEKTKLSISKLKASSLDIKLKVFLNIDKFIKYSHQKEFNKFFFNFKEKIFSTSPKQYFIFCKGLLKKLLLWQKSKLIQLSNSQIGIRTISLSLIIIGGLSIYQSYKDIYQSEYPNRTPASVQEYDYRPDYKTFQSRTLKVMNMKVPVEVESVREISSITIDFTIRTNTRFSKLFLENYEYKLKDYFFTTVEPIISDFPLENEGKDVLKEKITEEVNNFLRENAVEGVVEEIEIVFIVAS